VEKNGTINLKAQRSVKATILGPGTIRQAAWSVGPIILQKKRIVRRIRLSVILPKKRRQRGKYPQGKRTDALA